MRKETVLRNRMINVAFNIFASYHLILCLSIRYYLLAKKWHPDKNLRMKREAEIMFKMISDAYKVLSDAAMRSLYDRMVRERRN